MPRGERKRQKALMKQCSSLCLLHCKGNINRLSHHLQLYPIRNNSYPESTIDTDTLQLLQHISHHFSEQRQQSYLVGGSLRNLLLEEECLDWDIVTSGDAHKTARQLADTLGGHYVHMHAKASRVVV